MNDIASCFTIALRKFDNAPVYVIDARELHAYLQVGRDYSTWIRSRIAEYKLKENQDFCEMQGLSSPNSGSSKARPQRTKVFLITLDVARSLGMVENNDRGAAVRKYFIDCERLLRERLIQESAVSILLLPAPSDWKRRFQPPYYAALAKMANLPYHGHAQGTPPLFGKITDEWVYQIVMPAEVLAEMRERREGSQKLHQWLTEGGLLKLENQISRVIDQAKSSADYRDFQARCMRVFDKPGQLGLIYPLAA